jgi:SAM-dependent methyltransferase
MATSISPRQPHAALDLASRHRKGLKIERVLNLPARQQPLRMLEVGTGSGGIAHYFGTHSRLKCDVIGVDVVDNRVITDGYAYREVHGTKLPFGDACFDVVISNHVIEHVGDETEQRHHLSELRRVLAPSGVGYLAVPNRWMLTEPHYGLKFLSWWPRPLRTPYLRLMRRGTCYDCEPLQLRQLEDMLAGSGFHYENVCIEAWRATLDIERPYFASSRRWFIASNTLLYESLVHRQAFLYKSRRATRKIWPYLAASLALGERGCSHAFVVGGLPHLRSIKTSR